MFVGAVSNGVLDLAGSGSIHSADGTIGWVARSSGSVSVGGNARWDAGILTVGDLGAGDLTITGNGAVFSAGAYIGRS
jgi:T5SS/PEP-CTERM-associated repeat protein